MFLVYVILPCLTVVILKTS